MGILLFLLAALALSFRVASDTTADPRPDKRPNFVFIMTDDQDLHLNSLDYQQIVQNELVKMGTSFKKHFCTVSLCCPSRVSLLTGRAAHNTNVTDVSWPYGGYWKFVTQGLNDAYLPVWLQEWGYNTYYTGKLMNQHSTQTYNLSLAKGWTRSDFLLDPGTYSYLDGIMALDKNDSRSIKGQYSTDVIANRSLEFLEDAIAAGNKPFFLGVAPIAPHTNKGFTNPIPAERHKHLFPNVKIPRSPSFNPSTPGHVNYLKTLPQLTPAEVEYSDAFYRARLQTLQSVDELVGGIITRLEKSPHILENTYIIYTSDNGYHIGQHRLPPGKTCNIEEDINVPFIIRGPGIPQGKEVSFPTSHTDIIPTLFDMAGIPLRAEFDGVPMPIMPEKQEHQTFKNEHINVEYWGHGYLEGEVFGHLKGWFAQNTYKTLRLIGEGYDLMYGVWCTNEHQLYDMTTDPHQMTNLYGTKGSISGYDIAALTARLDVLLLTLKNCKGEVCRKPWKTLFPGVDDHVFSLPHAMEKKYDQFFSSQENVTFSECSRSYQTKYEGALGPVSYGNWTKYLSDNEWSHET